MAFFSKLKERLFKSSSKIEEGLDAIVADGGVREAADPPEVPPAPAPEPVREPEPDPVPAPPPETPEPPRREPEIPPAPEPDLPPAPEPPTVPDLPPEVPEPPPSEVPQWDEPALGPRPFGGAADDDGARRGGRRSRSRDPVSLAAFSDGAGSRRRSCGANWTTRCWSSSRSS